MHIEDTSKIIVLREALLVAPTFNCNAHLLPGAELEGWNPYGNRSPLSSKAMVCGSHERT